MSAYGIERGRMRVAVLDRLVVISLLTWRYSIDGTCFAVLTNFVVLGLPSSINEPSVPRAIDEFRHR